MRVTSEADYALRILRALAQKAMDGGCKNDCGSAGCKCGDCVGKLDARTISELIKAPPRFTVKILRKLLNGGLIRSYKGSSGGYTLARPAEEISVREAVELIDGPLTISRCLADDYECDGKHNGCYFHRMFDELNRELYERLERVKIADALKNK